MNEDSNMRIDRVAGSDAISTKAMAIGMQHDVVIAECVWDIGTDFGHEYAHRLDLIVGTKKARLYFSDLDLTSPGTGSRARRIEERLQRGIDQLVSRTPSPTYTYS